MSQGKLLLCVLLVSVSDCYKILGIYPYPGKSHFDVFLPLMKGLVQKGHEVTVISHFPLENPPKGYTDISLKETSNKTMGVVDLSSIPNYRIVKYVMGIALAWLADETCTNLKHPEIAKLLTSTEKYDVILIEQFNTDCFLPLVHHFKSPFIGISSSILMPWTNDRVANLDNPAYIPNHFMDFSDHMCFTQRVENVISYAINKLITYFLIHKPDSAIVKEIFGSVPDLREIARNMSLLFMCTHATLNRPRPLVPAIVEIGGLHIDARRERNLPQNIEKWINESDAGVIYFSMGSMIKGHTFPEDKRQAFLRAFGRLRQRVLWKWENDTMPGKPDNVMIQKWMPQFDILCHPNVKAFISHGGLLGITEAVHCGVPVVAMPQFGDQHTNAKALEAGGGGVVLNFADVDEDTVFNALQTVLDPGFNKKAKDLSERFRDRPMPPMETAIYWIEYVARHKGAHHLRTAAVGMPLYQYLLLDVIAFLILVITIATYITCKITKATFRFLFCKKNTNKVKKS